MSLVVMRHGESLWNKENKFTGWIDIELSDKGKEEATRAGEQLLHIDFDTVFTSDLKRSQQTAELVLRNRAGSVVFSASELIKERDYGELTGLNKTELKHKFGEEQIHLWRRSYNERPPKGENLADVKERVGRFYDSVMKPLLDQGKNVLMVAHGNSLRALFVHLGIKNESNIEHFELSTAVPIFVDVKNLTFSYVNDFELIGSQIFDSRGFPTIQVSCLNKSTGKIVGTGSTPSGASCGSNEVVEMRDGDSSLFKGKSVFKAISNIDKINREMSLNFSNFMNLSKIDDQLNIIDGTPMKSVLGGNTTTAVSFCMADVAARACHLEMYEFIHEHFKVTNDYILPTPFVNIINGGKHGVTDDLKIQEFMIFPNESFDVAKKMRIICEVYHTLKEVLVKKYGKQAKSIGDEGGFCPPIYTTEEALCVIEESITKAGYTVGGDVFMALDCASSEFYDKETRLYEVEKGLHLTSSQLVDYYCNLVERHPALKSIEDGFDEADYEAWTEFTARVGDKIMIVGDDLFTTNPDLIKRGLDGKWANALLLKVNQIGTVSEAVKSAKMMMEKGNNVIVSHRSGETNHAYIVDIAVGLGAKYLKIGSPCRGERVAKFNRIIEIEQLMKLSKK